MNHQRIDLPLNKKHNIALWKVSDVREDIRHVFLTHGTFSNRKVCMGMAEYLAKNGFTCWVMEWRNHGESDPYRDNFTFETVAKEEFEIVFEYLFNNLNVKSLDCVTHSGGGLCLTMFLANNPVYISKLKTATFFGAQTTGAAVGTKNYLRVALCQCLSWMTGYVPANWFGSPHNESHHFMKLWYHWSLKKEFVGEDGKDYTNEMPMIDFPILSINGAGDTIIAPRAGCESFLNDFKNPRNCFLFCSKEDGFKEDYTHSRIIYSRNAHAEIYPKVLDWINRV